MRLGRADVAERLSACPTPSSALARVVLETLETRYLMAQSIWAYPGQDGKLLYKPLPLGDKIGDYTNVGYKAGLEAIPNVPVKITVSPVAGDDQSNIQNAINFVQGLAPDANGFRGAVLLNPGTYEIPGTLNITASGVVLRGSGQGQTILLATGTQKDTTVQLNGNGARTQVGGSSQPIIDKYVPLGAISFRVNNASGFAVGDSVIVERKATANWIHDIGMDLLDNPWTGRDVDMDRVITRIDGNLITLDAPITQAIDANYGGATIWKYTATGRISNVGIEYVSGRSTFDPTLLSGNDRIDENHAEHFIGVDGVINGWVRNVTSEFYGYSCVNMTGPSKWVTVTDSQCLDPVSVVTGGRRYSFNMGDSVSALWKNLYTRSGRHDYVQGSEVTGPNVVVDSRADAARADTGPHHRYSTGTLWDNLDVNGNGLNIQNRHNSGSGHGWAGANQVVWNSEANSFIIQNIGSPVSAWNWAIGNVGTRSVGNPGVGTDGVYDSHGTKVDTRSLFHAQMAEKLAVDNWILREARIGDADNYVAGDALDGVTNVDAAWRATIEGATGRTSVGLDNVANSQLVPLTFNFGVDPGSYLSGASLSLGLKSAGGATAGDVIYIESAERRYTWAELGIPAPTTTQGAVVIDLSRLLAALQDGKLNLAISGNTAVDWATLNFQTSSITSARQTALTAAEDAYVNQASPTSNFGNDASLYVKRNGATDNRESYLKFDVTSIGGLVTNAYVRLVPTTVGVAPSSVATTFGNGVGVISSRLSFVSSDAWTESGINWNNKPTADPFFAEFNSAPSEPLFFDVTEFVRAAQSGDKKLSLHLATIIDNAASQIQFASSENGNAGFRPQLVIETLDAVGAVADATVRGGASANVNHGTLPTLEVKNDTSASLDNDREAFLRFDLNGLSGGPGNAFVRLFGASVPAAGPTHSAALVDDDAWSETGITWNTRPAVGGVFGTWIPVGGRYSTFNVTAAAVAAFGTDKLLSMRVASDSASSAAQTAYGSREHLTSSSRPLLISSNLRPMITAIPRVETGLNTPATGRWFGVWDAETPLASLSLSATSSNPALLPVANISVSGSGADRTLALTPAASQSGVSDVTITVTDAQGLTAQATFQFVVENTTPVDGDATDEVFRVVRNGANVNVFRNGVLIVDVPHATAGAYAINGQGGNDTFIVDYSGGNPIPAGGLSVDGGSGADTVRVIGTANADAVTLAAGNVSFGSGGLFDYAGGEMLELQLGAGGDTLAAASNGSVMVGALWLNLSGGGSLAMTAGSALPDITDLTVAAGTTFNLGGQNQSIDALAGAGTVLNTGAAAATLTVGTQGSNSMFAGALANGTQTLGLTKVGAGTLTLSGNNSYTGVSTLGGGVVEAALAASFAGLTGAVNFNGGTFRPLADTVAANVQNKWTTTFAGANGSNTGTFDVPAGVTLTLGAAGGPASMRTAGGANAGGQFIKTGGGTLRIVTNNGQQDDPFRFEQGTIVLESAMGLGGGDAGVRLDARNGTTLILRQDASTNFLTPLNSFDPGGTINVVIDRQAAGAGVTHSLNMLTSAGAFMLNVTRGANVTSGAGGLALGSATLGGSATLNVGPAAALNVTGAVGGAFGLTKVGGGTLLLNGVNTYTGTTTVSAGQIGGNGTIAGDVINAATSNPGNSPGVLTVNGNFTQSFGAGVMQFELSGPAAGTEYDQLKIVGTFTPNGKLSPSLGYEAAPGTTFVIVDNAGADPINGTFGGSPEGDTILVDGRRMRISYVGGDGNDLTLTVLPPPPVVTTVFVGGTGWTASFRDFLESSGQGEAAYGYRLTDALHADELPWINLNTISVRFSAGVTVAAHALKVFGVNVAEYAGSVLYDAGTLTATWTLGSGSFAADKLLLALDADTILDVDLQPLDGEWTNPAETTPVTAGGADAFPSGDGTAGGDFLFRMNVLPGDVNRSGGVLGNDVTSVRSNQGFAPGAGGYTIFRDVNGSGSILGNDVTAVRTRQGITLPPGTPVATFAAANSARMAMPLRTARTASPFATATAARSAIQLLAQRVELFGDEVVAPLVL